MIIIRASGASGGGGGADFTTDLVARLPFTQDANDTIGSYNATFVGSSISFDSSDGIYLDRTANHKIRFGSDGSTDHLSTLLNDMGSGSGTISFWVRARVSYTEGGAADNVYIFGSYRGGADQGVMFGYFDQNAYVAAGSNGGWSLTSRNSLGGGDVEGTFWQGDSGTDWVHIVISIDGTNITLYKDGSEAGSYSASTGFPIDDDQEWEINGMAGSSNTSNRFDGYFKDLSVWNGRVLTSSEVSSLYALGHGGSY